MRRGICLLFFLFFSLLSFAAPVRHISIPILTYHNFDPVTPGSMTISTAKFEAQLRWLKNNGYKVIPLQELVDYLQGKIASLPAKSVVITVDDGKKSVYTYMLPIVRKYNVPVTLFVYPTPISNASYAMTWGQLRELQKTGLFDIQSHTYWHPNFDEERRNLSPNAYEELVQNQLITSKNILEKKLGTKITLLAWPYGVYNRYLEQEAAKAGYSMAFSIDDRHSCSSEKAMAQPRYMIAGDYSLQTFATIVNGVKPRRRGHNN